MNRIVFTKFDGVSNSYVLKIRVELNNGWFLDFWEHKTPQMIVRWDNTPHYPDLKNFPYHKHEGRNIVSSEDMTVERVLKELEKMTNIN